MITLQSLIPNLAPPDSTATQKAARDFSEFKSMSLDDLLQRLAEDIIKFAINVAIAVLVFYIGRFIIRKIYRLVGSIFLRRNVDPSLSTFILSLLNMVLYFILIVTVIGILGIETTSFLALFASAGVALGMALSGTLQNFAGGVLILLLKPYKIGDYIEAQGYAGTVREIQIFSTIICTYDNKSISIPNGGLSTGSVNNWSREAYRRVAWTVSISYGDNVAAVRAAILKMFEGDIRIVPLNPTPGAPDGIDPELRELTEGAEEAEKAEKDCEETAKEGDKDGDENGEKPCHRTFIDWLLHRHRHAQKVLSRWDQRKAQEIKQLLPKPNRAPSVVVNELAASSVDLQVRVWVRTADYWSVFYEYNERFYTELPSHGANFPFPQMDVHLKGSGN